MTFDYTRSEYEELIFEGDGGSRGNPGPAGFGAVIKDPYGNILGQKVGFLGSATNNVAEYNSVLAGLDLVEKIGVPRNLHLKLDSNLVVQQLSGQWKIKHPSMQVLASQIQNRLVELSFQGMEVDFTWIRREDNIEADRLSNVAMDAGIAGEQAGWVFEADYIPEYSQLQKNSFDP